MKLKQLHKDDKNANIGNQRGRDAVKTSIERFGTGRSVLVDKDNRIIAGNKTVEQAIAAGIEDAIVVPTTGDKLVVVQRTDISLDDAEGRELAIADNRTGELGLTWDSAVLEELSGDLELKPFFTPYELQETIGSEDSSVNDADAEYMGMPEYASQDLTGARTLKVHFKTEADVEQFARLIGQKITAKTTYIWHPQDRPPDMCSRKYVTDPTALSHLRPDSEQK